MGRNYQRPHEEPGLRSHADEEYKVPRKTDVTFFLLEATFWNGEILILIKSNWFL